ncbi:MAG: UDP-N-acetylmuramate dehydrogenase [Acidobacteria bacterium]|nr:UDP-N-acetylmuramate dehydrogenase [Acidobacteriota bacterium]MCA1636725.1 UDP-N-acetylmuramate dehydrogenase [Acidobacteriota bacterium]
MSLDIQESVPLAEFTTFKIGGEARFFVSAQSEIEIIEALRFAEKNKLEVFILGGGSNLLIADEGFDGLVLQISLKGILFGAEASLPAINNGLARKNETLVTARAGENWEEFVAFCIEKNLAGLECLSGIPGFVGGTPVQNVGAYGQEVSETIVSVRCFDRNAKKIVEMTNAECEFAYRTSIFNTTYINRFVVLGVTYALKYDGEPKIVYKDLQNYFNGKKPNLQETRHAVLNIRSDKSMVINKNDPNSNSAGSFFKNPIVDLKKFAKIKQTAKNMGASEVPSYSVNTNKIKIPAAWLIEKSGFYKGFLFGEVGISTKHTLAIVNFGNAKASDVICLKNKIQRKVKEKFDVTLKPEPVFIGFKDLQKHD